MYFNVNFNVFFKLIKVHLLMSELYMVQDNFIFIWPIVSLSVGSLIARNVTHSVSTRSRLEEVRKVGNDIGQIK